ncbi:MAG: response regulator [Cyanobacteria bacterium P01_F01_bin.13]
MTSILIAEDDPVIVTLLLKRFEKTTHHTQVARDGQTALHLALSGEFDLIVLDLMLPKLDGMSVISAIRAQRLQVPIIAMTALDDDDSRDQALLLGANEYVTKPFALNHLLTCIHAYIG